MSRNGYACEQGKWPKAQDIYNELHELTSKPIYCVSDAAYKDIVENYFDKQCAKSKAITTEAKQYIPGGVQHNLAFNNFGNPSLHSMRLAKRKLSSAPCST